MNISQYKNKETQKKHIQMYLTEKTFEQAKPQFERYNKLMAYYRCAMMEIETKFNVLNEEFSLRHR